MLQNAKSASVKEVKSNQDTKNKAEKLQVQNQQECQVSRRTEVVTVKGDVNTDTFVTHSTTIYIIHTEYRVH